MKKSTISTIPGSATLALLLFLFAGQAISQQHIPEKLRLHLRTNELMGRKPSSIADLEKMNSFKRFATQEKGQFVRELHSDTSTFTPSGIQLPGIWDGDAAWFDFDNNGLLDPVVTGDCGPGDLDRSCTIFERDSTGAFIPINFGLPGLNAARPSWGDYDNDGDFDLLFNGSFGPHDFNCITKVFRNDNGALIEDTTIHLLGVAGNASWVDYDNDGQLDIFVCGSPDNGSTFYSKLYHNDHGVFTEIPVDIAGVWAGQPKWGDYDNDGDLDLVLTGYGTYGVTARIYRNDSNGVFTDIGAHIQPTNSGDVEWFDFDNDGDLDLVMVGDSPGDVPFATVYRNDGNDTFVDIHPNLRSMAISSVAVGDYDGDGYLDLAMTGSKSYYVDSGLATKIYHNNGDGTFTDIDAALPGTWYGSIEWGDYDNDGRLDLTIAGAPGAGYPAYPFTVVYHNNSPRANTTPTAPLSVSISHDGSSATLQWEPPSNASHAKSDLSYNVRISRTPGGVDVVAPASDVQSGFRKMPVSGNAGRRLARTIVNLRPGAYYYSVQAINNSYAGSPFSAEGQFTIGNAKTWKLVSAPIPSPAVVASLYPGAVSDAYRYQQQEGYGAVGSMEHGTGYWLKIPGVEYPVITSVPLSVGQDDIAVQAGWNLIGSVNASVPVSGIVTAPSGMTIEAVYGYSGGYTPASTIEPCRGYWVKAGSAGSLHLAAGTLKSSQQAASPAIEALNRLSNLTITDAEGNSQNLYFGSADAMSAAEARRYELPPMAPNGVFDARYGTQQQVALGTVLQEIPVRISGAVYPVTVAWNNRTGAPVGLQVGTKQTKLEGSGSVKLASAGQLTLQLGATTPASFLLEQNYPNPFNPSTTIRYALPVEAKVKLTVYTVLGQAVQTLVDKLQGAGEQQVSFDARNLSSGVYVYRLEATGAGQYFTQTRKLAVVK